MLHAFDRASINHLLTHDLAPDLRLLLTRLIERLGAELIDHTEILVVEAGDVERDIERTVGFSPLTEPIEGARYGEQGFWPHWDWLSRSPGWFEMVLTFGSTFACVLVIEDHSASCLQELCSEYTTNLAD